MSLFINRVLFRPLSDLKESLVSKGFTEKEVEGVVGFFKTDPVYRLHLDEDPMVTIAKFRVFLSTKRYNYQDILKYLEKHTKDDLEKVINNHHYKIIHNLAKNNLPYEDIYYVGTVGWYKQRGVVFTLGDKRLNSEGNEIELNDCGVERANESSVDDFKLVTYFKPRKELKLSAVHHNGVIEVLDDEGKVKLYSRMTTMDIIKLIKLNPGYTWRYKLEPIINIEKVLKGEY